MPQAPVQLDPGRRVTVVQQIPQRDRVWTIRTTGTIVETAQRKTGSWFAHAKDDRLWLDRLTLRKDDGELIIFNLDGYTYIEAEPEPKVAESPTAVEPGVEPDTDDTSADDQPTDGDTASDAAPTDAGPIETAPSVATPDDQAPDDTSPADEASSADASAADDAGEPAQAEAGTDGDDKPST